MLTDNFTKLALEAAVLRKEFQDTLQTFGMGGGSESGKWDLMTDPVTPGNYAQSAHRYFGGTQANGLYTGVNAAIDFIETIGIANIHNRIKEVVIKI